MKPIFMSMLRQVVKMNLVFLAILLVSGAAFSKFGYQDVADIFGVFLLAGVLIGPLVTSRKLPLLLSFPYSRNRLILLTSALHFVGAIISGFCILVFYSINRYFWQHLSLYLPLSNISHFMYSKPDWRAGFFYVLESPVQIAVLSLLFSFIALYLLFTTDSQSWGKAQKSVFSRQDKKVQRVFIAKVYGLGLLVFVLAIKSTFLFNVALLFGVNLFVAALVATSWSFSTLRRRKWNIVACVIGSAQVSVLIISCLFSMGSSAGKRRIDTVEYLGILAPKVGSDFIRGIVAQPIDGSTASKLVHFVGPKKGRDELRPYAWDAMRGPLSYREMIANQVDFDTLDWLVYLYDPRSLKQEDLMLLMSKEILTDKTKRWEVVPCFWQWLAVPLSDDLILKYLRSNDVPKMEFALHYIERHAAEKFFNPVVQGLKENFPGRVIPKAIRVLSILTAKNLDFRTYQNEILRGAKGRFEKIDCSGQSSEKLIALDDPKQVGFFNRCIREVAVAQHNAFAIRASDHWFNLPLSKKARNDLETAFREY